MALTNPPRQWDLGDVTLERICYFDTPLPAEAIGLEGAVDTLAWSAPWTSEGQPVVGQAFWLVSVAGRSIVVDPCGASDEFLRSGPDAVGHQEAAFAAFREAGHDPASIEQVVLTHLDGIGMVALADGAPADTETWRPAFTNAAVVVSTAEHAHISAHPDQCPGAEAFNQLDALGVVRTVDPPAEILPGVTLEWTGGHGPGHCALRLEGTKRAAMLVGHLAVSPLHAGLGASGPHLDVGEAWRQYRRILAEALGSDTLVAGSLWPTPGAAVVGGTADAFVLAPAAD